MEQDLLGWARWEYKRKSLQEWGSLVLLQEAVQAGSMLPAVGGGARILALLALGSPGI